MQATRKQLQSVMHQIIDLHINPLAAILTKVVAQLVENGSLTKDQAIYAVASSAEVIKGTEWRTQAKDDAGDLLMRMVVALHNLPDRD